MNIEKIEVKGHYVWVDKDTEIKEGDRYYLQSVTTFNMIVKASENVSSNNCYKIIAASPELNLEGIPTYVEWLAEQYKNDLEAVEGKKITTIFGRNGFVTGYQKAEKELQKSLISEVMNEDAKDGLYDDVQLDVERLAEQEYPVKIQSVMEGSEDVNRFERNAFIKGYKATEKELPTWDDVEKAIKMARETEKSKEEIIEQLKQSKK